MDHHNVVRGALTAGGTGNVTFAASASGKARPLSVLPTGWSGGIRFDDPNGVDWELSMCTALGNNVFSRDTLHQSSTGAFINLAVGTIGLHTVFAHQLNAFVSRATISGAYAVGQTLTATYPAGVVGTIQFTRTLIAAPYTKTLISSAVANAVNSLAYKITADDQGCRIDADCSNQVSSATGGSVPAAVATVKTSGTMRLFGTQATIDEPTFFSNATNGSVFKIQAPGAAIGCRISVHNKSPMMGAASVKASVAPTDISARDTAANSFNAQVAGVVSNSAYDATTKPNGFRKATWNGAAQSRRLYPTNAVLPSLGYNNQEETVISDIIPLPGYGGVGSPIKATDRGTNSEYYFILRLTATGVVGQDGLSHMNYSKMQALTAEWTNSNGADTPLLFGNTLGTGVDAVDGSFAVPGNGNGYPLMFSVEWIYPSNITPVTVLDLGDSLIEGYRWPRIALNRRNTNPLRPLHHVCLGGSTTRTESFVGNMYLYLQTQARPDYVLMEIISPNNYSPLSNFTNNISNADVEYNRLVEIAQFLTGLGIKIIWWVPVNYSPKVNPTDPNDETTSWNKLYNKAKKYAAANGIAWCDINGDSRLVWTTGSTYNANTNSTSWNGDGTHPSDPVGIEGFATIYGETLASLGF